MLFTTWSAPSHLRALVPIALAAREAGHTVAVAGAAGIAAEVESHGLDQVMAGQDVYTIVPELLERTGLPIERMATLDMAAELAGSLAISMAADVIDSSGRPDVVVRGSLEFGGALAAQVLGVPHASVAICGASTAVCRAPRISELLRPHRSALGLGPDDDGAASFRYLNACLTPEAYDPAESEIPNTRFYRQVNPRRRGEHLPRFVADLPSGRPWVYASLGSLAAFASDGSLGLLRLVVAALGELGCAAVVATGTGVPPGALGPLPEHVHLVEHAPQPLLLECCDLFVTHAGHNSIRESLRCGVPVVCLPMFAEQPYNAQRCAQTGVGEVVPAAATGDAVLDACRAVLGDARYRQRARGVRAEMLALPGQDVLVADLEGLVTAAAQDRNQGG